jgi:ankyrin repeat domain-containing protein 50
MVRSLILIHPASHTTNKIQAEQQTTLLDWLSTIDPTVNHRAACSEHQPGTGNWLLESDSFKNWLDGEVGFLWIQGISGSGKTILCSTLIDAVSSWCDIPDSPRSCLGYFYFDFNDESKQSALGALRSVIRQISKAANVPKCVRDMFTAYYDRGKAPSLPEFVELLLSMSSCYERTFIIMDALDESKEIETLASIFEAILRDQQGSVSILVTSRKERAIEKAFEALPAELVPMDSDVIDADIRLYISERLANDSRLRTRLPEIKREIEKSLAERAQGMCVMPLGPTSKKDEV